MRGKVLIGLILPAYLAIAALFALQTPAWQAPDEPAHYNYVRQLAAGTWPVIEPGDYNQAYQEEVISSRFAPQYSLLPFSYEDHQPPLYYLLQTPFYRLGQGSLRLMRLVSVLLGAGVVAFTYASGKLLFPGRPWLAAAMASFVAFLPQHVAMLASVNNDSLAELEIAGILWLALLLSRRPPQAAEPWPAWVGLGLLLGLGLLTKATVYIMAPLLAIWLLWRYGRRWPALWRTGGTVFLPALALGALWWGRNLLVYAGFDPLATAAHNRIVAGQPRTAAWLATFGPGYTLQALVRTTFQSFWGQFGWMGVPMPPPVYLLLLLFTLGVAGGLLWRARRARALPFAQRLLLGGTLLLSLALFLAYNLTFVQHQGRYLFPALVPISAAVAAGAGTWLAPFWRRWQAATLALPLGLALGLAGLDLLALYHFILPALSLP